MGTLAALAVTTAGVAALVALRERARLRQVTKLHRTYGYPHTTPAWHRDHRPGPDPPPRR